MRLLPWPQVLPLVPPEEEFWSPYTGLDALCGSTLVISLDELVTEGLLQASDLPPIVADGTADFFAVCACMHAASSPWADLVQSSLTGHACAADVVSGLAS